MNCWHCDRPAHGVCKFCGRAVCREHAQTLPYVVDVFRNKFGAFRGLVVADALYCNVCEPQEEPISMEILDEA
jgi:hypothetical protein